MNISTTGDNLFDRRFDTLEKEFKDSLTKKQDLIKLENTRILASEMSKRLVNEKNFNSPWIMIRDDDVDPDMTVLVKITSDKEYGPCLLTDRTSDMLSIAIVPEHFEINCEIGTTGCIRIIVTGDDSISVHFNDKKFSASNKNFALFCNILNEAAAVLSEEIEDRSIRDFIDKELS
jgi:hypothetical protein